MDKALDIAKEYNDRQEETPESLFYLGLSNGILGVYHAINRNYFSAYIHGKRGKGYLEDVIKADSTYYDAYLGLGIFHYYVDLFPGLIKFFAKILGFEGDRERGKKEIKLTVDKGEFFKLEARFIYAIARYFLEGAKSEAFPIFIQLQRAYPHNPAPTLLIGYHYRRKGKMQKAIHYFSSISDKFQDQLPQIPVMKYYNLAVCHFRLNNFQEMKAYLNKLSDPAIRKSRYYYAALAFYKGLAADLEYNRRLAERYYSMIQDSKDTQYWYHFSRLHRKNPMDSLLRKFIVAENEVFTYKQPAAKKSVNGLLELIQKNPLKSSYPHIRILIHDLNGVLTLKMGKFQKADSIYQNFMAEVDELDDDFQKAWIYIHYARVLRELGKTEHAKKMLEKAEVTDDQYTRIIIERERFIIKEMTH